MSTSSSKRIALGIAYDGAAYHGWQAQENDLPTVQLFLESALSRVADHPVKVICAGRTDARVHAVGQVVHFDSPADRSCDAWLLGCNSNLPRDINVHWAREVDDNFHARFSATARRYRYVIYNDRVRPAIFRYGVTWAYDNLDVDAMQQGANYLLGEHDFTSFRGADCQANTATRNLTKLEISRKGKLVTIEVEANAFLLHMVRNIAGVLMPIGSGKQSPQWAQSVLAARCRREAGVTASPRGLYLVSVSYPQPYDFDDYYADNFFF